MRYTINDKNTIEIFVEGQEAPVLRQPTYPNGDSFDTYEEAETWANLFIASTEDENAPYAPAGKGLPGDPKPTKDQLLAVLKEKAETFGDNVPQPLLDRIAELEAK